MKQTLPIALLIVLLLLGGAECSAQYTGITATSTPGLNIRHPLTTDQSILFPPDRDMMVLQNDLISVSVFGVTPAYADIERVALDGTIKLPLAGMVHVGGLTITSAEKAISQAMEKAEYFHDAQVSIVINDMPDHVATIVGAVAKTVPLIGKRKLLDVLSVAGGLPPTASTLIQIDRPSLAEPIYVDLGNDPAHSIAANIPIFAGDVITTGDVGQFFVVGAVNSPGAHPLQGARPTTVLQAIASVGGTSPVAKRTDARLIRTTGNTRSVIPLQLADIEHGVVPDPVLQADDIILVPTSAMRSIFRTSNGALVVSAALALTAILR